MGVLANARAACEGETCEDSSLLAISRTSVKEELAGSLKGEADAQAGDVLASSSRDCEDANVEIHGKSCSEVYKANWCSSSTQNGKHVGKDLCPASCGFCVKTCRTQMGNECVFPFRYGGKTYGGCTREGHHRPWCSIRTDSNGNHVQGIRNWGSCRDDCPDGDIEISEHAETVKSRRGEKCGSINGAMTVYECLAGLSCQSSTESSYGICQESKAPVFGKGRKCGWHFSKYRREWVRITCPSGLQCRRGGAGSMGTCHR